ncbi:hypothetical protein MY11210_007992 [Beauveria gryllotalpidicola]
MVSYRVSKAALSMLKLQLQLRNNSRKEKESMTEYWAVSLGHCRTAFNGHRGRKDPEEGAEVVVRLLEVEKGVF